MSQVIKQKIVAINGSAGAFVDLTSDIPARKMVVVECPPGAGVYDGAATFAPQGLNYSLPDDGFVAIFGNEPAASMVFQDDVAREAAAGRLVAMVSRPYPGQLNAPATIVAKLRSATVTGTQVLVRMFA